jgi:hypothetical protein
MPKSDKVTRRLRQGRGDKMMKWLGLVVMAWVVVLAGCQGREGDEGGTTPADEAQLPAEAQQYLALGRAELSALLNIDPGEIALESMITPAERDGIYEIKLVAGGFVYEYLGQGDGIKLVRQGEAAAEP